MTYYGMKKLEIKLKLKNFNKVFKIIKIVEFKIHSKKQRRKLEFSSYGIGYWLGHKNSHVLKVKSTRARTRVETARIESMVESNWAV